MAYPNRESSWHRRARKKSCLLVGRGMGGCWSVVSIFSRVREISFKISALSSEASVAAGGRGGHWVGNVGIGIIGGAGSGVAWGWKKDGWMCGGLTGVAGAARAGGTGYC